MTFSAKTLVLVTVLALGIGALLPLTGRSQNQPQRVRIPRLTPSQKVSQKVSQTPIVLPTEIDKLNLRVADLEAKIAAQDIKLSAQKKDLDAVTVRLNAHPAGYTKAFITIGNFNRLPATDAISYWARY